MLPLARNGYTKAQVIAALHSSNRKIAFRYEVIDKDGNVKGQLHNVIDGEIRQNANANIKRTAKFTLDESQTSIDIDYLSDKIAPYVRVWIPPGKILAHSYYFPTPLLPAQYEEIKSAPDSGGWVEFPQGVFYLSSPTRADQNNSVIRNIEAFDGLIVLKEDKFVDRYTITSGTSYYDAIIKILQSAGVTKWNIEQTDKVLETDVEFEPGKEKLFAINELLRQINYESIKVDVYGYYTSSYYRSSEQRSPSYTYIDDEQSVTLPGMKEEFDLSEVPNQFVVVRSNGEQEPLRSEYTNNNPDSPVSTVNRNRTITDYREVDKIADQESLDGYTLRIASEASQIYGKISFQTAIMPMHDIGDAVQINYSRLGINEKYSEQKWSFPLRAGGVMKHELRRVVTI